MPDTPSSFRRPFPRRRVRATLLLLPSPLLVLGASAPAHTRPVTVPVPLAAPVTLFAFGRAGEADWDVVNDGVMGGRTAS